MFRRIRDSTVSPFILQYSQSKLYWDTCCVRPASNSSIRRWSQSALCTVCSRDLTHQSSRVCRFLPCSSPWCSTHPSRYFQPTTDPQVVTPGWCCCQAPKNCKLDRVDLCSQVNHIACYFFCKTSGTAVEHFTIILLVQSYCICQSSEQTQLTMWSTCLMIYNMHRIVSM